MDLTFTQESAPSTFSRIRCSLSVYQFPLIHVHINSVPVYTAVRATFYLPICQSVPHNPTPSGAYLHRAAGCNAPGTRARVCTRWNWLRVASALTGSGEQRVRQKFDEQSKSSGGEFRAGTFAFNRTGARSRRVIRSILLFMQDHRHISGNCFSTSAR